MPTFLEAVRAKYLPSEDDVAADEELIVADEGQKETKKWIMVGMDKLKKKTMQLDKLVNIAVGTEGVDAVGESSEISKTLPSLRQLELSEASFKGWDVPSQIMAALPDLTHLDLSQVDLRASAPTRVLGGVKTLVLNGTHTTWTDVCKMAEDEGLAQLERLHLDSNDIERVGACSALRSLKYLSLIKNQIDDWEGILQLVESCPVRELVLESNKLVEPNRAQSERLAASGLTLLSVASNAIETMQWLEVVGQSAALTSLKVSYPAIKGTAPNYVRLLVIAEMPQLTSLNASSVSAKERSEAEKFYILRAFSTLPQGTKHNDECSDLSAEFLTAYKHYAAYVKKWHNPSSVQTASQGSALGSTVSLIIRDSRKDAAAYKPDFERAFPVAIKISQLKMVIKAMHQIPLAEQQLTYKSLEYEIPIPTPLDSDLEPLLYYGITGGKGLVELV